MRDDSILSTFAAKVGVPPRENPVEQFDTDSVQDCGAFGWIRGAGDRSLMLELRRRDGSVLALGYPWLSRCEYDPSSGITLSFSGQSVRIIGRNLNVEVRENARLFEGICRHRIAWLQEADEPTILQSGRSAVVIEQLVTE